jgi:hypothetical protein
MTNLPKFEIVRTDAIYCPSRDGLIGSRTVAIGRVFHTAGLAHKIVAMLENYDYAHGGDGGYSVREIGSKRPLYLPVSWPTAGDTDCPF